MDGGATYSLYSYKLATYTTEDEFDHEAAAGFIELWGLPIEIWARIGKEHDLMRELVVEDEAGERTARLSGEGAGEATAGRSTRRRDRPPGVVRTARRHGHDGSRGRALGPFRRRALGCLHRAELVACPRLAAVARRHRGVGGARPRTGARGRHHRRRPARRSTTAFPGSRPRSNRAPSRRAATTKTSTWRSSAA